MNLPDMAERRGHGGFVMSANLAAVHDDGAHTCLATGSPQPRAIEQYLW